MKTLTLIIIALFLTCGMAAQESRKDNNDKKTAKRDRKEERKSIQEKQFDENTALINGMRFVLEADFLVNRQGERFSATSGLNFILVDSGMAVIQYGRNTGLGNNGVGGITAKGSITSWKVERNEKKRLIYVRMNVNTSVGFYSVTMSIPSNGKTTANVSPSKIDFFGQLVPLKKSIAYEGWSL